MANPMYGQNKSDNMLDHAGHSTKVISVSTTLVADDSGSTLVVIAKV